MKRLIFLAILLWPATAWAAGTTFVAKASTAWSTSSTWTAIGTDTYPGQDGAGDDSVLSLAGFHPSLSGTYSLLSFTDSTAGYIASSGTASLIFSTTGTAITYSGTNTSGSFESTAGVLSITATNSSAVFANTGPGSVIVNSGGAVTATGNPAGVGIQLTGTYSAAANSSGSFTLSAGTAIALTNSTTAGNGFSASGGTSTLSGALSNSSTAGMGSCFGITGALGIWNPGNITATPMIYGSSALGAQIVVASSGTLQIGLSQVSGGATGNAVPGDVRYGKTFSSAGYPSGSTGTHWIANSTTPSSASSTDDVTAVKWGVQFGPTGSLTGTWAGGGLFKPAPVKPKGPEARPSLDETPYSEPRKTKVTVTVEYK